MPKKQQGLPGVDQPEIAEIDDIGSEYLKQRDERIAVLALEVDAKKRLTAALEKHGLKSYRLDDERVAVLEAGKEKLKIKKLDADGEVQPDDDDND